MAAPSRFPRRPPRLTLFADVRPFYFITFVTADRKPILANREVHDALLHYAQLGYTQHGVAIGRYVIMPDHVHLFVVLPETGVRLTLWVRGLKRAMGDALASRQEVPPYWQEGFFDHVLRHGESHSEKWHYVRENPVRRGLATRADDWPWQGELVPLRY